MREEWSPEGRKATLGAFLGLTIDFYDIYLPVVALTPAIALFIPTGLPPTTKVTISFMVLAVTFLGRPVGAFIFGHLGDVLGRKRTTMIAVAGFGVMTGLIGVLPGYASWGMAAPVLLLALRFVGGIFMGGEYTSANPLALETAPKRLRGLIGGVIQSAYPVGYIAVSATVAIILTMLPSDTLESPYVQYGWRIPFFVGAGLAFLFLFYYWFVAESEIWKSTRSKEPVNAPLRELFSGQNFRNLSQVFLLMLGLWLGVQTAISLPPTLMQTYFKLPAGPVTDGFLVGYAFLFFGFIAMALLGQAFGRRRMLILSGVWTFSVGTVCYWLMLENIRAGGAFAATVALLTITLLLTVAPWGIVTTYISERFQTGIRSSGYGIGYSLAVIPTAFSSFYLSGLSHFMPYYLGPLVLMVLAGVLVVVGAWIGPETRDVDMATMTLVPEPERGTSAV
ncbi:MFS transporter [Pseudonocardia acaciae]|uniref:MFS transporter n=1 Tax=Pseudonocardia acaciae TaxID=551276 RepID=UPI000686822E|nr:MFS transporter [Pseudonocardia acaciae]